MALVIADLLPFPLAFAHENPIRGLQFVHSGKANTIGRDRIMTQAFWIGKGKERRTWGKSRFAPGLEEETLLDSGFFSRSKLLISPENFLRYQSY